MKMWIPVMLALLSPAAAYSDVGAVVSDSSTLIEVRLMCSSQTSTGACTRDSDQIVLDTSGYSSIALDLSESSATAFSCNVYANNVGHDSASGVGQVLNSTTLSESQLGWTGTDTPRFVWINCSAISGGSVTVTVIGRKIR